MRTEAILGSMSLRDKIAQTFMVDFRKWNGEDMSVLPQEVAELMSRCKFGSFILFANNVKTTEETLAMTKALQEAAVKDGGLPLLITIDQEGGSVIRLGSGTALPGNMALCASGKTENARLCGQIIGKELMSVGINCTLAPTVDINNNANNPVIGLRSFGDDPADVSDFGNAYIQGVSELGAIACVKHFPGHGDTDVDSHYGLPKVDKSYEELKSFELIPFASAIKNGAEMVMTAHILYPKLDDSQVLSHKTGKLEKRPATMSRKILTDILKGDLGFDGVVTTDAINMAGVAANFDNVQASVEALNAGADMLCMPVADADCPEALERFDEIFRGIEEAVSTGLLPIERLDDAILRILKLKEKHGILDYDGDGLTVENALATLGCPQHRQLERKMALEAVTLVRNENDTLPLSINKGDRILFMFPYANEQPAIERGLAYAMDAGNVPAEADVSYYAFSEKDFEGGALPGNGPLLENLQWADYVIAVSEISNSLKMQYSHWMSGVVRMATEYCTKNNKKSVVLSIDKPYDVQLYPDAGAVLAAYGSKAAGPNIAAAVEGALSKSAPTGRLPVDVPRFDREKACYTEEIVYRRGY